MVPNVSADLFRRSGRRNSWDGGWRHVGFYVERLDGWWWRKPWAVKMDYSDDRASTRGPGVHPAPDSRGGQRRGR